MKDCSTFEYFLLGHFTGFALGFLPSNNVGMPKSASIKHKLSQGFGSIMIGGLLP